MKKFICSLFLLFCMLICHQQLLIAQEKNKSEKVRKKPTITKPLPIISPQNKKTLFSEEGGGEENPTPECVVANAGPNRLICRSNGPVQLGSGASQNYTYTYSWSPATGLSATDIPNPTANPSQTTTYTLTITPQINLITNGGFEDMNTGFSSDFTYFTGSGTSAASTYSIVSSPASAHSVWCHTAPAEGNYIYVGDGTLGASERAWYQTVTVSPSTTYQFGGQFATLLNTGSVNDPNITIKINGTTISAFNLSYDGCQWTPITATWNSGSSSTATIEIYNYPSITATLGGNDFGIDNLSLVEGDCPMTTSSTTVTVSNPTISPTGPLEVCYYPEFGFSKTLTTNLTSNIKWSINGYDLTGQTNSTLNVNDYTMTFDPSPSTLYFYSPFTVTDQSAGCASAPVWIKAVLKPDLEESNAYLYGTGFVITATNPTSSWVGNANGYGLYSAFSWQILGQGSVANWPAISSTNATAISSTSQAPMNVYIPNIASNLDANTFGFLYYSKTMTGSDHASCNTTDTTWLLIENMSNWYNLFKKAPLTLRATPENAGKEDDVLVYPNPVKNNFTISAIDEFKQLQVFSSKGELIKTVNTKSRTATINVSGYQPGTYFINVLSSKGIKKVKKLIVVK